MAVVIEESKPLAVRVESTGACLEQIALLLIPYLPPANAATLRTALAESHQALKLPGTAGECWPSDDQSAGLLRALVLRLEELPK